MEQIAADSYLDLRQSAFFFDFDVALIGSPLP